MRLPPRSDSLLAMVAGPIVWTLHFLACYLTVSLACAAGQQRLVLPGIATATAASLVLLAGICLAAWRRWRAGRGSEHGQGAQQEQGRDAAVAPFFALVTLMLSVLSAVAVLWVALPGAMLPACAA